MAMAIRFSLDGYPICGRWPLAVLLLCGVAACDAQQELEDTDQDAPTGAINANTGAVCYDGQCCRFEDVVCSGDPGQGLSCYCPAGSVIDPHTGLVQSPRSTVGNEAAEVGRFPLEVGPDQALMFKACADTGRDDCPRYKNPTGQERCELVVRGDGTVDGDCHYVPIICTVDRAAECVNCSDAAGRRWSTCADQNCPDGPFTDCGSNLPAGSNEEHHDSCNACGSDCEGDCAEDSCAAPEDSCAPSEDNGVKDGSECNGDDQCAPQPEAPTPVHRPTTPTPVHRPTAPSPAPAAAPPSAPTAPSPAPAAAPPSAPTAPPPAPAAAPPSAPTAPSPAPAAAPPSAPPPPGPTPQEINACDPQNARLLYAEKFNAILAKEGLNARYQLGPPRGAPAISVAQVNGLCGEAAVSSGTASGLADSMRYCSGNPKNTPAPFDSWGAPASDQSTRECSCGQIGTAAVAQACAATPAACKKWPELWTRWGATLFVEDDVATVWLRAGTSDFGAYGGGQSPFEGVKCNGTPLVLDLANDGIALSSPEEGVTFDLTGRGAAKTSWLKGRDDAFLAIDRNGNGQIDGGGELFGDAFTLSGGAAPDGFHALAKLDRPSYGGNGNGIVESGDLMFEQLLLWNDRNADGLSQPEELQTLQDGGVTALTLSATNTGQTDEYGNGLGLRSTFIRGDGQQGSLVDVYFISRR